MQKNYTSYLLTITIAVAMGGFLFGYDTAVISGTVGFLRDKFSLTPALEGWVVSSGILGAIFGAIIAGPLADRFGRKPSLWMAATLFLISAVASALAATADLLVIARIVGGVGFGMASMLSPLYIAEVAPAKMRGRLVSVNQLAIVSGMFIVYFVNYLIQKNGIGDWNVTTGWRWMFASEILPALLFMGLLLLIPESPRWLCKMGKQKEAEEVLSKLQAPETIPTEIAAIQNSLKGKAASFADLMKPKYKAALIIGIFLAIFQQASGINAILYYAPEIFKAAGESASNAFAQTIIIGATNLIFTLIAIATVDSLGRKKLLIIGNLIMTLCLLAVGFGYGGEGGGSYLLIAVIGYIAAFAISVGPVTWVVISEIFPTELRGTAMSVATGVLWLINWIITQTFPIAIDSIGSTNTFLIYAAMAFLSLLFVAFALPETKGKSLEEISQSLAK